MNLFRCFEDAGRSPNAVTLMFQPHAFGLIHLFACSEMFRVVISLIVRHLRVLGYIIRGRRWAYGQRHMLGLVFPSVPSVPPSIMRSLPPQLPQPLI
jgi:hypothetical protein